MGGNVCSRAWNPDVELALNLVWLILAAVSLLLWGIHSLSTPRRDRNFTAVIALTCVLCFLFPVISMSDDLNTSPALCETGKLKKWISADMAEALVLSSVVPPALRQSAPGRSLHPGVKSDLPSQELVWSNLDRRPPPHRF
jgi:hypothetical protein